MKKIFTILAAVVLTVCVFLPGRQVNAQTPPKMSYQAVIRDAGNALVTSHAVGMRISILQGSAGGTVVYTETQTPATNANGLISIEIGGGTGFDAINWANGPYFLKTETDPTGGTNYTAIVGTSQLLSVPYALHSKTAQTADYNNLTNLPNLSGYLINESDPLFGVSSAHGITNGNITNWNTAFSWGNHAGLYRSVSYVPAWAEITSKPTTVAGYGITDAFNGSWASLTGKPTGNNTGDMQYWNGTTWVMVPVGQPGQFLQLTTSKIPTWSGATYPTLTTTPASSITSTTATSGGIVTSDGGATVTSRGVCWSTSANPTIANTKTTDGTGTGIFTSSITGLTALTTYYVRAYAINSAGTAYGKEISFTTPLSIGDSYQGGKIAYILQPGDPGYIAGQFHGLIAAPSDQSTGVQWGCYATIISGADGTAIGTGNQNTIDIVTGCTTIVMAARLCYDLILNGYSDWYLPSKDEFNKLFINKDAIGGFASALYWSSTEYNSGGAWVQDFYGGLQGANHKANSNYVRAIRAF